MDRLFQALSRLPEVEAVALGGSRAGTAYDERSDYDVYVYCTGAVSEQTRRTLLAPYCSVMEIGNHFWEYEDNCTLKNGVDIDILYRDLDALCEDVASVVERCEPRNAYTTCMWHNLRTCRVLYDRDGRLAAAKRRFDVPYPELLRSRILERGMRLLHGSLPAYDAQLRKAVSRGDCVSVSHRAAAFMETYFDVILALNRLTHPGEKRLVPLCAARCERLPEHFEENIRALYADLFTSGERVDGDVQRIVQALEALVAQCG
ncbi:MAG: DUF4037 domain-containing protein [Candidatus Ventricola sp.]